MINAYVVLEENVKTIIKLIEKETKNKYLSMSETIDIEQLINMSYDLFDKILELKTEKRELEQEIEDLKSVETALYRKRRFEDLNERGM